MPPLRIEIQPSRRALILLGVILLLSILSVSATSLIVSQKVLILVFCFLISWFSLYQLGWFGGHLPTALRFNGARNWYLHEGENRILTITEFNLVYVSHPICFFKCKVAGRRRQLPLLLFNDSCDPSSLRRLRVIMRHGRKSWTALK